MPVRVNVTPALERSSLQELDSLEDVGLLFLHHRACWRGCGQLRHEKDHEYNCGCHQIAGLHRDSLLGAENWKTVGRQIRVKTRGGSSYFLGMLSICHEAR
jgi:hypothetical protein